MESGSAPSKMLTWRASWYILSVFLAVSGQDCSDGYTPWENNCYKSYFASDASAVVSWHEARSRCMAEGGDLASVLSQAESDFIQNMTTEQKSSSIKLWIGLYKTTDAHNYSWSDGGNVSFTDWGKEEPTHSQVQMCTYSYISQTNTGNFKREEDVNKIGDLMSIPQEEKRPDTFYFGVAYSYDYCRGFCNQEPGCFAFTYFSSSHPDTIWQSECVGRSSYYNISIPDDDTTSGERTNASKNSSSEWYTANCGNSFDFVCKRCNGAVSPKPVQTTVTVINQCPEGYVSVTGSNKCFKIVLVHDDTDPEARNWTEALKQCRSGPGKSPDLASIHSDVENALITAHLQGYFMGSWIGIAFQLDNWLWSDNSEVTYLNWAPGEPSTFQYSASAHCGEIWTSPGVPGQWNNHFCEDKRGYVCQTFKDPDMIVPSPTPSICQDGWMAYGEGDYGQDNCYKLFMTNTNVDEAESQCLSLNGHLVSIHSEAENSFVYAVAANRSLWLGFRKVNITDHVWTDGWPVDYTRWSSAAGATGNCVMMGSAGQWTAHDCTNALPYMCKITNVAAPTEPVHVEGTCPSGWIPRGQYCYRFGTASEKYPWYTARSHCQTWAGEYFKADLAQIHSEDDNNWITKQMNATAGKESFWICFNRAAGTGSFSWCDNTGVDYLPWAPNEPNGPANSEICVEVVGNKGYWNDQTCTDSRTMVCQTKKETITTPAPGEGVCHVGWEPRGEYCYYFGDDFFTWDLSREKCKVMGQQAYPELKQADLASINDDAENIWICDNNKQKPKDYWIGLERDGNGANWVWANGDISDYTKWAQGEPNGEEYIRQCVHGMHTTEWNDHHCNSTGRTYVCKARTVPKPVEPTPGPQQCESDWIVYGKKCVQFIKQNKTWTDARQHCRGYSNNAQQGELVTISNDEENWFFHYHMREVPNFWIGLFKNASESSNTDDHGFAWLDETNSYYRNWASSEPNDHAQMEDCVEVYVTNFGQWNDIFCNLTKPYICQLTVTVPEEDSTSGCCGAGQIIAIVIGVAVFCGVVIILVVAYMRHKTALPASGLYFNNPLSYENASNTPATQEKSIGFESDNIYYSSAYDNDVDA